MEQRHKKRQRGNFKNKTRGMKHYYKNIHKALKYSDNNKDRSSNSLSNNPNQGQRQAKKYNIKDDNEEIMGTSLILEARKKTGSASS